MANSADPDQLASFEANWSGSTLFAKAGYIRVQLDKSYIALNCSLNCATDHKPFIALFQKCPLYTFWCV